MTAPLVRELAEDGYPVAVTCEVLGIARSSYYEAADRPPSARAVADAELTATIARVHADSRGTYGAPRVHAELRLGLGICCGRKRVARLMRDAGLAGVCHRRKRGQRPAPATHEDLVKRVFTADAPDRVWFTDITQHRANDGWVYCCAVIDAYTRRIVGWSIADHIRPSSSSTPWRWPAGNAGPHPGRSCTPTAAPRADSTGRRNTSMMEVCGGEFEEALAGATCGCAAAVGGGPGVAAGDALTGAAGALACGTAGVLAADRDRGHDGGGVGRGGRVLAGRDAVVSPRWRDDAVEPG